MIGDLKATFVQRSLAQYMERVIRGITTAAARAKVGVTDEAIRSLAYDAMMHGTQGGEANLRFREYLRMVDMGAGRGHPVGGLKQMTVALQASNRTGLISTKDNIRKPKKIYSKVAYGNLTWLQNQLLYGFTEEVIEALKKEMLEIDMAIAAKEMPV